MEKEKLQKEIRDLKEKNDVTILAHYYQTLDIQEIADYLGDSLGLSRTAKEKANTKYVIFSGVLFMAETASILNQDKHVLIPNKYACCPLADFLTADKVIAFKRKYPGLPVVTYVNSTAAVKAVSDICCTSSNSINIVNKISKEFGVDSVLFGPDSNLGDYVSQNTDVNVIKMPKNGHCVTHSRLSLKDLKSTKKENPDSVILVHPECVRDVREFADYVGSTAGMYKYVKNSKDSETKFIIGTEKGLLDRLSVDFPDKELILAKKSLICKNMKKNSLERIYDMLYNLDDEEYEVKVPSDIAEKALLPIEKMLKYS
ncbi:MAG: quinolinate synthase NadA [Candidatus Lokiarchaeota archaeon]